MKNLLISILCIVVAFCTTLFILNNIGSNTANVVSKTNNPTKSIEFSEEEEEEEENNPSFARKDSTTLDFSNITVDHKKWNAYNKENIDLSTDFIAVDVEGKEITKREFLERLITGNYISIKLSEAVNTYQLYILEEDSDKKIPKSVKNNASANYSYFLKEGTAFPKFNFTDLNGNNYTNANTKGKYVVIECWFIRCAQCVLEFPEINALYDNYEDRDDIVFFSLAFDEGAKIKKFLAKKEFRYPVIANQKDFMQHTIKAAQYPTHIILDKQGAIKKMVSNITSLKEALANLIEE